ncbi:EscU/YscU/HrcU family type III secretion system export apparatus switch protein [Paenibacillus sp. TRM 82003]|nr:EscU/YscU/HrcU family type III secretion system export apparatus switch protein [Paenibacillus sp. TRM 82003]
MTKGEPQPKKKSDMKQAVALAYAPEQSAAPVIKAKGKGVAADRIVQLAAEHGVPVKEDASLVEVLSKLDLEQEIPAELYRLVAEILSFVYRTDQEAGGRRRESL